MAGRSVTRRRSAPEHDRRVPWRFRLGLFLLGPAAWLLQLLTRSYPELVERSYARGVYPYIRELLSTLTGWSGWSLVELVLIVGGASLIWRTLLNARRIRRGRRSLRNVLAWLVSCTLALGGVLVAWAVLGWGLNYNRQPFAVSAGLDSSVPDALELRALCERLAFDAASLRQEVDQDAHGVMRAFDTPREALGRAPDGFRRSGGDYGALVSGSLTRAKAVRLPLLPWLNISGVFSMFTSEPNVAMGPPAATVLASACHELAHQLGWAREDEAGFVGYVACRDHPDADFRYAVTQAALRRSLAALQRADPVAARDVYDGLGAGIVRDWNAARAFWERHDTRLGDVSQRVNDAYLKSQGQQAGVESYGMMVELLVGDLRRAER